jgi:hypothetical protein
MQSTTVFMESPAGEVKEISVTDPNKDIVPLMVAGYHQVFIDEHAPAPAATAHQEK